MRVPRSTASFAAFVLASAVFLFCKSPHAIAQPAGRGRGGAGGVAIYKDRVTPNWFGTDKFWYRNDLPGGAREFILVDAIAGTRLPAFDHQKLAAALAKASAVAAQADRLPFDAIQFVDDEKAVRFTVGGTSWKCSLDSYEATKSDGPPVSGLEPSPFDPYNPPLADAIDNRPLTSALELLADAADDIFPSPQQAAAPGGAATGRSPAGGRIGGARSGARGNGTQTAPNNQWTALVRNNNVVIRNAAGNETQLTQDGQADDSYTRLSFSPDSTALVAFRMAPGDRKQVYRIQSSPPPASGGPTGGGVGRAVLQTSVYPLPGDKFDSYELNIFTLANLKQIKPAIERIDMSPGGGDPNPVLRWKSDGFHFTIEKYDRGHQRFRLVEVDTHTGGLRNIIDEKSRTFIWSAHTENMPLQLVNYLRNENEIIYISEMDGWRHLYFVDAQAPAIKQITKGQWVIRGINNIDQQARQIWFTACGVYPSHDPYLLQYGRVNFDGTGLTWLTDGDGNHSITFPSGTASGSFSPEPDHKYVIDTYSRVDMPPVTELRRVSDGKLVVALEKAQVTGTPNLAEVFTARGRDDKTDIWGIICRPRVVNPSQKYPIIEDIYAGPQGAYTPKTFSLGSRYAALTNLGFIVVQMDAMGTAYRSKAFHDVCWQNLADAGFPDRIRWIQAAAAKYPYMDTDRVGIFGTSAGGQNAAAAVLFHPEFYKVAVANSGCHDNRMDKASWNEQWMGYPVGPQYSASSNIDNAYRLRGHLQLVVGELDTNVPPEATYRFVDALIKARRDFDFVMVPGADHGADSNITEFKRNDFFVRYLLGAEPANRNAQPANPPGAPVAPGRGRGGA